MTFAYHDKPKVRVTSFYLLLEAVLTLVFVLGVRSLYYSRLSVPFFWCGYLSISFLTIRNITSGSSINQKLLGIILYSLSLHLIVPLVQPIGIVWDQDAIFTGQVVQLITEQKNWVPGAGTGAAAEFYSNYPLLPLLEVSLNYVTSIDVYLIQQYLMLVYSPLFLTGVFMFMRKATGNSDMAILSSFLFATNPFFEFVTTITAYQGLGYVFAFFALTLLDSRRRQKIYLFLIFSFALSMTHHWSSYNLILFSVLLAVFFRLSKGKSVCFNVQTRHRLVLFLAVAVASWTIFIAAYSLSLHADMLSELTQFMLQFHTAIEGELTHPFGPRGALIERFFNYLGLATFICLGLYGSITSLRRKRKLEAYLFFFGMAGSLLGYYIAPWQFVGVNTDIRNRLLDYAYLYAVPAATLGIWQLGSVRARASHGLRRNPKNFLSRKCRTKGIYVVFILLLLLTPSTIIASFPKNYYTADVPLTAWSIDFIDSSKWMEATLWIRRFIPPGTPIWSSIIFDKYIEGIGRRPTENLPDLLHQFPSPLEVVVIHNLWVKLGDVAINFTVQDMEKIRANLNLVYNDGSIEIYHR